MYIDPCTDPLNATYVLSTNVLFIGPTSNAQRAKGKNRKKNTGERKKTEEALPRQIGTGSLCENRYERSLDYSCDVTHLVLVKSILWYRCAHDRFLAPFLILTRM